MTLEKSSKAESNILTAVLPKSQFFWDVALCLATDVSVGQSRDHQGQAVQD